MGRKKKNQKLNIWQCIFAVVILSCISIYGYINQKTEPTNSANNYNIDNTIFDLSTIPEYSGTPYVEINNNIPYFTEEDYTTKPFEKYNDLGNGKAGVAYANICKEIMPKEGEERGEIGNVKDLSGWVQKRYDNIIKDKYLYNRCHLIENEVAQYIDKNENNHVLYRVTPIFEGNNLLANGVEIEAYSVEDKGQGVCFNVYCYNVQPGIAIDHATGENYAKK